MRAPLSVAFTVAVAALLAACGGSQDDGGTSSATTSAPAASAAATTTGPVASLAGTTWSLTTVGGATAEPGGLLAFAEGGHLTGSTGCNDFGATYTQSGSALTIAIGFQTAKACDGALGAQETAVNAALPEVASFSTAGDALTLLDASGKQLLAYGHLDTTALVGPAWEVTGINNGKQAVSSVIVGSKVTATFGADGTVSGSAGCNTYSAPYTLTGDSLKVGPVAATRKLCTTPGGVMEQEAAFLQALEHSTIVEPGSHAITLRDGSGATQLTLGTTG
jgi:heat shock protein HslJ